MRTSVLWLAGSLLLALAGASLAAPPVPPDAVAYSAVLVDGGGVPLVGPVDLTARIYDAASAGTLVYKQSFTGVALSDGHFTVSLGPTGSATDSPTNPLTTSLRTALTGNLAAAAGRFVQITVNTDPPLARVQLVLVPYAMRSDHAATSDVATNALDTESVGGLDSAAVGEIFEVWNFDGGPPSTDPREGLADPDGDGDLNFVDPDNDDDALSDSAEVAAGSDINLVTPTIAAVTPDSGEGDQVTPVTVSGSGFVSGLTAQFGTQLVSVTNLTSTSFEAGVGPHPGPFPASVDLTVTNANGEAAFLSAAFTFGLTAPSIDAVTPNSGEGDDVTQVTVTGSGFLPGLEAQFGTQVVSVTNLTSTSFEAGVGPHPGPYAVAVDLTVTNTNGQFDVLGAAFTFLPPGGGVTPSPLPFTLATPTRPVAIVAQGDELLVYGSQGSALNTYAVDTIVDGTMAFDRVLNFSHIMPSALSWNASRVVYGLRGHSGTSLIQLLRDNNGDEWLAPDEAVVIESPGTAPKTRSPGLAFDGSARPGGGYLRLVGSVSTAVAFHDRDGNGTFGGVNEVVVIEPVGGSTDHLGDAVFDPSGRLAYVYYDTGNARVRVAHDRSADGDFGDSPSGVPELATAASIATPACLDASFDGSGRLGVLYVLGGSATLLYDRNGDADFTDANESQALPGGSSTGCDLGTSAASGRLVIVHNPGNELRLLVDINDDGDFADGAEDAGLSAPITAPLGVATTSAGAVRVLTRQGVVAGPVR